MCFPYIADLGYRTMLLMAAAYDLPAARLGSHLNVVSWSYAKRFL